MPFLGLSLPLRTGGGKICRVKTILRVYHILFVSQFPWLKRISLSQIFRCLPSCCHHQIVALELELAWGQGQQRKTTVDPSKLPLSVSYGGPSFHSLEQKERASLRALSVSSAQFLDSGFLLSPGYNIQEENKPSKLIAVLVVLWVWFPFPIFHYFLLFRGLWQLLHAFCLWFLDTFTGRWRVGCAYST